MGEMKALTEKLPKEIMPVIRIGNFLSSFSFLLVFIILLGCHYYFDWLAWIGWILIGLIVLTLLALIWELAFEPYLTYKNTRYAFDEEFFQYQTGRLQQTHKVIPMVKIQSVETSQGPILRKFNLMAVHIHTLGSGCKIPGLVKADAIVLRNKIANYANIEDESV